MEKVPFQRIFGSEVGNLFKKMHEMNGIKFITETSVHEFLSKDDTSNDLVGYVSTSNNDKIEADVVILGIGVVPCTDFVPNHLTMSDKGILVNQYLNVLNDKNIYAAGDVARFPLQVCQDNIDARIEHWNIALQQGRLIKIYF